jgi:hypothetical protein
VCPLSSHGALDIFVSLFAIAECFFPGSKPSLHNLRVRGLFHFAPGWDVEWREGISPSRPHRTVLEPLDSYGSYRPTVGF